MAMLDAMDEHDLAWVDVKRDVMDEYNEEIQRTLDGSRCGRPGATATTGSVVAS